MSEEQVVSGLGTGLSDERVAWARRRLLFVNFYFLSLVVGSSDSTALGAVHASTDVQYPQESPYLRSLELE